jgi:methionine-S-sulfoxide reductase
MSTKSRWPARPRDLSAMCLAGGLMWLVAALGGCANGRERIVTTEHGALATFAGGCFWCMEPPFEQLEGVLAVTSGYTGGDVPHPSYEQVCSGETRHLEAIQVEYDSTRISYAQLLEVFWQNIDPTDAWGQFADQGSQYRTAVFCHTPAQRAEAQASKEALAASGTFDRPIVTEIRDATPFYPAEDHHQDYYRKQPLRYQGYKEGSGRAGFLRRVWGADHKDTKNLEDREGR